MERCQLINLAVAVTMFALGVVVTALYVLLLDENPLAALTPLGRAKRHYRRERERRAALYVREGLNPDDALTLARAEMQREAGEFIRVFNDERR